MNTPVSPDQPVVLFDGHCGLCQRSVRYLLRHERAPVLQFAAQQSAFGRDLLAAHDLPPEPGSLVYILGNTRLLGADAALHLCTYLRAPHRWLRFGKILPTRLRHALYHWIARRRYRWFGRTESCPLPDPEHKDRFFDAP